MVCKARTKEEAMKNENTVHPFWKWAWRVLWGLMLTPLILFPAFMFLLVLAEICIVPYL